MPRRLPAGCVEDTDRHGNIRIYYRVKGRRKIRLRGVPWTSEFMREYEAAKSATPAVTKQAGLTEGTWRWLCVRYFADCAEYKRLDLRGQRVRRQILEATFDEPLTPESKKFFRDLPLKYMEADHVEILRDRKLDFPGAANNRVKAIHQVCKFGVRKKHLKINPAAGVEKFKPEGSGYHTWSIEEVQQYCEHHALGSKARLYLALLLFTGQRRSDVIRMGKQMVSRHPKFGRVLAFTQHKGRRRKPKRLILPILPILQSVLDASPVGDMTFLVNELNRPFSDAGIGNKMREWCDAAKLYHCASHGVRKAGATIAAEEGATAHELMSIFGWSTMAQAEVYTKAADQARLAAGAMHMLAARTNTGEAAT